mmetsp:Transcript_15392/g.31720  ORF Transcript_15392/g.31720 Transcript_15392/m.31720 type:complete len:232 (-) Transcript_15392:4340-5035(-)
MSISGLLVATLDPSGEVEIVHVLHGVHAHHFPCPPHNHPNLKHLGRRQGYVVHGVHLCDRVWHDVNITLQGSLRRVARRNVKAPSLEGLGRPPHLPLLLHLILLSEIPPPLVEPPILKVNHSLSNQVITKPERVVVHEFNLKKAGSRELGVQLNTLVKVDVRRIADVVLSIIELVVSHIYLQVRVALAGPSEHANVHGGEAQPPQHVQTHGVERRLQKLLDVQATMVLSTF